jgi:rubrerythrin
MGFRCSLLGHNYGDSEVEREREEQGSEVVVTIREEQTCSRCGKTKLLSENKEVTSLATRESDPGDDAQNAGGSDSLLDEAADGTAASAAPAEVDGDGHDAEIIDGGPDDEAPPATREAASVTESESDEETPVDPETDPEDDAVILDETEDETPRERERGEWPESNDTRRPDAGSGSPQQWPDVDDGEDEGYDARPDSGKPADVEFGGGLTPESGVPDAADGDERMVESAETPTETGFTSAGNAPSPVDAVGESDASEFVCPECGHTASGTGSSLRAGDICPECKKGYIAER